MKTILTSFCHGYKNEDIIEEKRAKLPSILLLKEDLSQVDKVFDLYFPRLPVDFSESNFDCNLVGDVPDKNVSISFKRKPRFGVMGLCPDGGTGFYAATWNGIYHFNSRSSVSQNPDSFITNKLINDPHGIVFSDGLLYVVLTALDALVCLNPSTGNVEWAYRIDRNLKCIKLSDELLIDWRFIGKQDRGAVGNWHFNNVTIKDGSIWLTSRLTHLLLNSILLLRQQFLELFVGIHL